MNPSDTLRTDSNISRTNTPAKFAPAASDHPVVPTQVEYFDLFCPAQAYSVRENSCFLEGPGHPRMHPPHAMYCDLEYPSPHMYSPALYPAGPLPPSPDTSGLVPPTVTNIRPPSILPIAFAEAVSDEELEQPLLAPAKVGGKGKGPTKPQADPDSKLVVGEAPKKGWKDGATGYSADEVNHILKEIVTYNQWAWQNHMMERSSKAIQVKYDMICRMEKPTGDGELPEYVELARQIEDSITRKSGMIALDDSEWDEGDIRSEIEGKDVLEVSSESDKGVRGAKDRDETWLSSLVQFNQINTLQAELREVRQRIESLNDRLMQECCRADCAESQVEMLNNGLKSLALAVDIDAEDKDHRDHGPVEQF
ncbi:uncharacterized protein EDB91DRAFT_1088079 [Suillus paluster]|uniref:uncharacterized protein n=1 Tax=Suillus paluster TaxID=48578 RepID=UPI001B862221|nr:uncharacterized protein EDB91DRAFT_1088079 [Suillus paluster]KAG1722597.1 hypothetical protein EDB91DRAFT_1088079 [Suillus paluster]